MQVQQKMKNRKKIATIKKNDMIQCQNTEKNKSLLLSAIAEWNDALAIYHVLNKCIQQSGQKHWIVW